MLSENKYTQAYIDACRLKINADIENYNRLITTARTEHVTNELLDAAIASFESVFFNNLLVVLDNYFVYRNQEEAEGGVSNEVRTMAHSIMTNSNKITEENTIAAYSTTSILNYKTGDEIKLNETDFIKLSKAFFDELESRFIEK